MPSAVALHVSAHPDDEALGAPGALHLLRRDGWAVVNVIVSLGRPPDQDRRRAEAVAAGRRAGYEVRVLEPPIELSRTGDQVSAVRKISRELTRLIADIEPTVLISPSPHDRHHGHEAVGRAVEAALRTGTGRPRQPWWWMWGVWADLPFPNLYVALAEEDMAGILYCLDCYEGELRRNDYRRYLPSRDAANVVLGSERVFGFGSPRVSDAPYAELLTSVRLCDGRWLGASPAVFSSTLPDRPSGLDLTSWIVAPSARELVLAPDDRAESSPERKRAKRLGA